MKRTILNLTLAALLPLGAACGAGVDLKPATGAETVGMWDAAVDRVANVRVVANPDAWAENPRVAAEVTPIKVSIENNGNQPVVVRYNDFALVSPTGDRYAALPPFAIQGTIEKPVPVRYSPIYRPGFVHDRFEVAPFYAGVYPGVPAYADPFYWDLGYYNAYETYWKRVDLPTPEMLNKALPEGVIQPGGSISGFLYFEKVDPNEPMVKFRADLVNARTNQAFGQVSIPFEVAS